MRQAGSYDLFAYWEKLRGERAAPERMDLDPAAMRNLLADTFLLEVDAARTYPFCVTGTRLNAIFNTELKGHSFISLWDRTQKDEIASMLRIAVDGVSPVIAGVAAAPRGYDQTEFELLLLPLRHGGKTHARLLGRLAPAKQPSWLGLIQVEGLHFVSMRVLQRDALDGDLIPSKSKKFEAGADAPYTSVKQQKYLRIYVNNG